MEYGTLRVATPDGQIREYPITEPSVVIGIAPSRVRRHAPPRFTRTRRLPPGTQEFLAAELAADD
jgi:hypothetical protein